MLIFFVDKMKILNFEGFSAEKLRFRRIFFNLKTAGMKLKILFFLCFSCSILYNLEGKDPIKKVETQPVSTLQFQLMNEQISALMADRIVTKNGIAGKELATIDEYLNDELMEHESMIFPADELYGGTWDTTWVNPFRNRDIIHPDSFFVDCTTFIVPIDNTIKVTSVFGVRGRRMHTGIDLKVQKGDTIRAAFSGKVRIKGYERRGYGNYLVIRHPNGLETLYGHLSGFLVSENEIVKAGQPIGLGGNTGRSTGTHLHFETRFLGQALNPSSMIDFDHGGMPRNDQYALYRGNFGKNTNIYTSSNERIVYHRVKSGETLGKIALQYRTSVAELCRLNGLTQNSVLRIGQTIRCGTTFVSTTPKETDTSVAEASSVATGQVTAAYHTVQTRETLSSIARQYATTVDALCRLNNIQATTPLRVGQEICYRAASKPITPRTELPKEEGENRADETALIVASTVKNAETESVEKSIEHTGYHEVKQGESLFSISKSYNTSVAEICRLNGMTEKDVLRVGQTLRLNESHITSTTTDNLTVSASPPSQLSQTSQPTQPIYYSIKEGDTLSAIAQKHGITINQLCELNNITKTTVLRIGRSLRCS